MGAQCRESASRRRGSVGSLDSAPCSGADGNRGGSASPRLPPKGVNNADARSLPKGGESSSPTVRTSDRLAKEPGFPRLARGTPVPIIPGLGEGEEWVGVGAHQEGSRRGWAEPHHSAQVRRHRDLHHLLKAVPGGVESVHGRGDRRLAKHFSERAGHLPWRDLPMGGHEPRKVVARSGFMQAHI